MYLGDFAEDATVNILFTTHDKNGGSVAPSTAFEAADVKIYKDNSDTEKTATDGLTMSAFDSITGLHSLIIDTSDDTNDAGFWVTGSDYAVVLSPSDETVDSETVVAVIATFSIENRFMRGTDSANTTAPDNTNIVNIHNVVKASGTGDCAAIMADTNELQGLVSSSKLPAQVEGMDADVLTASALKADAVTEIQSGLATGTNVTDAHSTTDGKIDAINTQGGTPALGD